MRWLSIYMLLWLVSLRGSWRVNNMRRKLQHYIMYQTFPSLLICEPGNTFFLEIVFIKVEFRTCLILIKLRISDFYFQTGKELQFPLCCIRYLYFTASLFVVVNITKPQLYITLNELLTNKSKLWFSVS